mmetsp:Transcript_2573/g.2189  ORF Transcript_2573/g.2189 Transcript_2573/m.2189 type:complete len:103 (-) Transcript_2573:155-463(-)
MIKIEDYKVKNFVRLSQEIYSMADQTLGICKEVKDMNTDHNPNIQYFKDYIELFEPVCTSSYQLYKEIHKNAEKVDAEKCMAETGNEDYLENVYAKKKPQNN